MSGFGGVFPILLKTYIFHIENVMKGDLVDRVVPFLSEMMGRKEFANELQSSVIIDYRGIITSGCQYDVTCLRGYCANDA